MTSEAMSPKLPVWPFALVDVFFLAMAGVVYELSSRPLLMWQALLLVGCGAVAAWSFLYPFLRRDSAAQSMARVKAMSECVTQINQVERLAAQIAAATSQWQSVQEYATKVADVSKDLSKTMVAETKSFEEFLRKSNDAEKAHLRLEVDKFRRSEVEWLQVVTTMLDHVYALYSAAVRSKMQNLIAQIGQFQNVCRDAARRVGLVPVLAEPGEAFDEKLHDLADPKDKPAPGAVVEMTFVTGYRFQGQLVRKAIVGLRHTSESESEPTPAVAPSQTETPPQTGDVAGSASENKPESASNENPEVKSETPQAVSPAETDDSQSTRKPTETTGELGL